MKKSRRSFIQTLSLVPLLPTIDSLDFAERQTAPSTRGLKKIGEIQIKKPIDISESPFGIGCETLDRELWDVKEVYPWLDRLPVKWGRLQTGWSRVERVKGVYDWKWLDESVDGLIERGIQPFFNVGYGNKNYTEGDMGYHPMVNPEAHDGWKRFVKALAKRYRNKVQYYEIWNEPNLGGFWRPGQKNPRTYVELVRETSAIIRWNYPKAIIVGGVVSRLPFTFIKSMFEEGLGKYIDIFSFHPYSTVPESYTERIIALKKLVRQYNPSIQVWQGENGFPSHSNSTGFSGQGPWTENIQAKIMLRRLLTDCSLDLPMTLWFLIVDLHDYPKGTGNVNHKGILRVKPEIQPKVAFKALQHLGSLVYGKVVSRNSIINVMDGDAEVGESDYARFGNGEQQNLQEVRSAVLNTTKGTVLAYWSGVKAADVSETKSAHIFFWDWEGTGFEEPVLLNVMTGSIFEIESHKKFYDNDKYRISQEAQLFKMLPLYDYPMLIMERKSVM